ncbi:PREDICTED: uncharacterized protein LOC105503290 [Colobus angolensis palliatus]|uniref:uncharacterized protein LOC105503290 n=1 Tax=Colobus angolensis palliatus TaxID=336983 RepID=UPI0005F38ED0|nr:PREDICTED: uncharacterized protein LOC105503290 [Colobus angolensis palliatus]
MDSEQCLRSCTGSTWGHSSWTGNSRAYSSWTGSRMTHSLRNSSRDCSSWTGSSRVCSSWTGSRMTHSLRRSSRVYSSCTGSSLHRSHSPPWSLHRSHSPPWNPHKSHSPPWSLHRSHSWSRNRLAHSSTRACSSRQAHSSWSHSPHSQSHSPHSRSHSPHSWSHSLQSSHSSPWFWWIEGGAGRGAGEREVQVWSSLSLGSLYSCPGSGLRWKLPLSKHEQVSCGSAPAWPAQGLPHSGTCGRQRPFQGRCAEEDAPPGCRAQPGKQQLHSGAGPLDAKESPRRAGNRMAICSRDPNTCECPEPSQRAPGQGVDTGWHSVALPASSTYVEPKGMLLVPFTRHLRAELPSSGELLGTMGCCGCSGGCGSGCGGCGSSCGGCGSGCGACGSGCGGCGSSCCVPVCCCKPTVGGLTGEVSSRPASSLWVLRCSAVSTVSSLASSTPALPELTGDPFWLTAHYF